MSMQEHSPTVRGRIFLWSGIALGLLFLLGAFTHGFGLLGGSKEEPAETPALKHEGEKIVVPEGSRLRERLKIAPASAETVSGKLALPAIVEADPARTATVLTALGGRLIELKVALGDRVARGQVLAMIDSPDLAQAYEDNDKAADTNALTKKNLERQEGQHELGAASDRDVDQARSDHAAAAAEYVRTQARLRAIGVVADHAQRSALLAVRAPIAGSVTTLNVAPGNMINDATQPLMTVADLSTVWVTGLAPENRLAEIAKGQDAEVALADSDEILRGKVLFVSDVLEADSRRNKFRIAFANPRYVLKPNMFATVTLSGATQKRVVVPTSALLMNNDRTSVFVATAPWTFERRVVDAQLQEGQSVVIASGLKDGEQIVVSGGILLND